MLSQPRRPAAKFRVEQLEDRVTPSWGSIPPSAIAIPVASTLSLNSSGDISGTAAITNNEIDWFRFTLNAGTTNIATTTPSSNLDTVIGLYNSSGQRVAYNDDVSSTNTDSLLGANLASGTYYLGITNYVGTSGGGYTLFINGPSDSPVVPPPTSSWGGIPPSTISIPASSLLTLNSLGNANTTAAAITNNEVDWFRFTVAGATTIATTTPNSNLDTVIGLYNSNGQRVAYNDDVSSTNSDSRLSAFLPSGTYYIGVTNYDSSTSGAYTLFIAGPSSSPPPVPPVPPASSGFGIEVRVSGLTPGQQTAFQQAANRWAQVITGDLPNATYNGVAVDDLLIDASAVPIDGSGGVLGQAGPDRFRTGSRLPYHGTMQFDTADLAALEANGQLTAVVLHEMGHILGIGTIWDDLGVLSGAGTSNPRFIGAQATAQYNAIFGRNENGVPVENSGGSGTADSHWRESILGNEVMTGYVNSGSNPLSRITIGSLADLGYQVNYSAADNYTPPSSSLVAGGGTGGSGGSALRSANSNVSIALAFDAAFANRNVLPGLTNITPTNCSRTTETNAFESLDHLTRGIRVDAPTTTPSIRPSVPVDMLVYLED